jgi:hypothetical protein
MTPFGTRCSFLLTDVQEKSIGIQPKETFLFIACNGNEAQRVNVYRKGWEATTRTVAD